jgi:ornithine cyclodeaminase
MPAYLPSSNVLEVKLVSLFEGNAGTDLPTHQAAIAVFDPERGNIVALMDGTYITATRTAAGAALSVRELARKDARVLAICGTGVQGRSHLEALRRLRDWDEIRVAGRDPSKAEFTFEDAVRGADVVCATTHSPEPVVRLEWLKPGVHVTSVGMNPEGFEVDAPLVEQAAVFVESRAAAFAPFPAGAGELAALDQAEVTEIGEVLAGTRPGRTGDEQLTLYKSVGVGVMDAAAAALVLAAARERGVGTEIAL